MQSNQTLHLCTKVSYENSLFLASFLSTTAANQQSFNLDGKTHKKRYGVFMSTLAKAECIDALMMAKEACCQVIIENVGGLKELFYVEKTEGAHPEYLLVKNAFDMHPATIDFTNITSVRLAKN